MTITKEKVLSEALNLPPIQRAQLIEDVLSSFEFQSREETDKLWEEEAESRIDAYEQGTMKKKSAQEVFKNINNDQISS